MQGTLLLYMTALYYFCNNSVKSCRIWIFVGTHVKIINLHLLWRASLYCLRENEIQHTFTCYNKSWFCDV